MMFSDSCAKNLNAGCTSQNGSVANLMVISSSR